MKAHTLLQNFYDSDLILSGLEAELSIASI